LRASDDFRATSATLDANGDGVPDYGYQASGAEQLAEIYYRFHLHKQFELTPDFQLIRHPGANPDASTLKIVGLRAKVSF
jgi:carbohydrate-selective porin OprB